MDKLLNEFKHEDITTAALILDKLAWLNSMSFIEDKEKICQLNELREEITNLLLKGSLSIRKALAFSLASYFLKDIIAD